MLAVFVFKSVRALPASATAPPAHAKPAPQDVGFGTIVGSAVFNVLFVIGLCAYFSGMPELHLTW